MDLLLCLFLLLAYNTTALVPCRSVRHELRSKNKLSKLLTMKDPVDAPTVLIEKPSRELIEGADDDNSDDWMNWVNQAILVAGTTVGAGVLALPEVAQPSGIVPSAIALSITWVFMVCTGLLYAEVGSNIRIGDGQDEAIGVLTMIERTLGKSVSNIAGAVYLFIHYTLLIAYILEAGNIINDTLSVQKIGSPIFAILSGMLLLFGSEKLLESVNSVSLAIILASFFSLSIIGGGLFDASYALSTQNFDTVISALPIMLLALVYHNVVPVIAQKLNYDRSSIQKAIVFGTAVPLVMFIIWIVVILGMDNFFFMFSLHSIVQHFLLDWTDASPFNLIL